VLPVLLPILITLLVVGVVAAVAVPFLVRPPVDRRYAVAAGSEVRVAAPDARLDLTPSTDGRVHVHVVGWSLVPPEITVRTDGGTTTVRGRCSPASWFGACSLRFAVALPPAADATVDGSNGAITAERLTGTLTAGTTNGSVVTDAVRGTQVLRSTNGRVEARRCGSASVRAGTTNGSVSLAFRTAPDDVLATSTNGSLTVAVPGGVAYAVRAGTTNGSVDTSSIRTDPASTHRIEARTTNGSVRFLPSN
jgi:hypothetical protein